MGLIFQLDDLVRVVKIDNSRAIVESGVVSEIDIDRNFIRYEHGEGYGKCTSMAHVRQCELIERPRKKIKKWVHLYQNETWKLFERKQITGTTLPPCVLAHIEVEFFEEDIK